MQFTHPRFWSHRCLRYKTKKVAQWKPKDACPEGKEMNASVRSCSVTFWFVHVYSVTYVPSSHCAASAEKSGWHTAKKCGRRRLT
jgi:hypothetical protein